MFEKEAEEYSDEIYGKENRKTTGWILTKDDFQKGAEFGYNKAKVKLDEAKEIINEFFRITQCVDGYEHEHMELVERADAFLKE